MCVCARARVCVSAYVACTRARAHQAVSLLDGADRELGTPAIAITCCEESAWGACCEGGVRVSGGGVCVWGGCAGVWGGGGCQAG